MPPTPPVPLLARLIALLRPGTGRAPSIAERLMNPGRYLSEETLARLRARQVSAIRRLGTPLMTVNLVNTAALLLQLRLVGQITPAALVWAALAAAVALGSLVTGWRARHRPPPETASPRAVRRVIRSAALFGLVWAIPGVAFLPWLDGMALAFATALFTGMIAGGAIVLYPIPAAATAFLLPVAVTSVAGLAWTHGWLALAPAVLATTFLWIFLGVIRRHADLFTAEFIARTGLEQRNRLIEDLLEDTRLEALGARRLAASAPAKTDEPLLPEVARKFGTLFGAIRGNAELIRIEGATDRSLVEPILEASWTGTNDVHRLLAASGRLPLSPAPIEMDAFLESLLLLAQPVLGDRVGIRTHLALDLRHVFADATELGVVLVELMRTASAEMAEGGMMSLSCGNVSLDAKPDPAAAEGIAITIGYSRAPQDRTAGDPDQAEGAESLTFAAARGFARQSGGSLALDRRAAGKTVITLLLPAEPLRPHASAEASGAPKVLLVEDNPIVRSTTERMLSGLGYRVLAVSDAAEALRLLSGPGQVDIVLTDVLLSGPKTGLRLSREARRRFPDLPVAFMSGIAAETPEMEHPDDGILAKPFTRAQLAGHLRETLGAD